MTTKDLATVAFKALSAWLFAGGLAGLCSGLLTWSHDVGQWGTTGGILGLAAAAIYIPIGAGGWWLSDWAAQRVFPRPSEATASSLTRADLYAFASVLVGLFLLAEAVPVMVYWVIILIGSPGKVAAAGAGADSGVDWVAVRAGMGTVATKAVLGLILLGGPDRVQRALRRVRREFGSSLDDTDERDESREHREGGRTGG